MNETGPDFVQPEETQAPLFRFSTASLSPVERFQHFRQEAVHAFHWEAHELPYSSSEFEINWLVMRAVVLVNCPVMSPAHIYRNERAARRNTEDFFLVCNTGHSRIHGGNNGERINVIHGGAILVDSAKPADIEWNAGRCGVLVINRDALMSSLDRSNRLLNRPFDPRLAETRLLLRYINLVASEAEGMAAQTLDYVGTHLLDLVACAAGPKRDFRAEAEGRGLKAARLASILSYIRAHAANPGLTVSSAASHHRVSERYVQVLLEETGRTFTETVLEHRLLHAYRLLQGPRRRGHSITEIAYECGFSSLSYFNRSFRRRFGDTPTGVRASKRHEAE